MASCRVAVCPVDDAAARVGFVLAAEGDVIGRMQIGQARREVDVVRDQHRFSCAKVKDEALVAAAFGIVLQYFFDLPRAADRRPAALLGDDGVERGVVVCAGGMR